MDNLRSELSKLNNTQFKEKNLVIQNSKNSKIKSEIEALHQTTSSSEPIFRESRCV